MQSSLLIDSHCTTCGSYITLKLPQNLFNRIQKSVGRNLRAQFRPQAPTIWVEVLKIEVCSSLTRAHEGPAVLQTRTPVRTGSAAAQYLSDF